MKMWNFGTKEGWAGTWPCTAENTQKVLPTGGSPPCDLETQTQTNEPADATKKTDLTTIFYIFKVKSWNGLKRRSWSHDLRKWQTKCLLTQRPTCRSPRSFDVRASSWNIQCRPEGKRVTLLSDTFKRRSPDTVLASGLPVSLRLSPSLTSWCCLATSAELKHKKSQWCSSMACPSPEKLSSSGLYTLTFNCLPCVTLIRVRVSHLSCSSDDTRWCSYLGCLGSFWRSRVGTEHLPQETPPSHSCVWSKAAAGDVKRLHSSFMCASRMQKYVSGKDFRTLPTTIGAVFKRNVRTAAHFSKKGFFSLTILTFYYFRIQIVFWWKQPHVALIRLPSELTVSACRCGHSDRCGFL